LCRCSSAAIRLSRALSAAPNFETSSSSLTMWSLTRWLTLATIREGHYACCGVAPSPGPPLPLSYSVVLWSKLLYFPRSYFASFN
jgi:hypothetical protein